MRVLAPTHPGRRRQRGQALVMVTLSLLVMLGMAGLVVDLGWAYFRREAAQSAAEAAAIAAAQSAFQATGGGSVTCGAQGILCQSTPQPCPNPVPYPPANNFHSGCSYAAANGFVQGGRQSVTLAAGNSGGPPTAPGVAARYWVTARVSENLPQLFSAVLGNVLGGVTARATAIIPPSGGGGCVYVLRPNGTSVTNNGNAHLESACGIYINSNSSTAVVLNGNASIEGTGGASVNIVGGWLGNGNAWISPAPNLGVSPADDPFASMQPPAVGACTSSGVVLNGHQTGTIDPGVYCGAIILNGQSSLTMNPGVYVLKSGITVNGGSSLTGNGVTLYNQSGSLTLNGSSGITLTAPESGPWQGILIFQDRGNSSSATLNGGSELRLTGAMYFPNAQLTLNGGSSSDGATTTIVVRNLVLNGNAYIRQPVSTPFGGGATPRVMLVE